MQLRMLIGMVGLLLGIAMPASAASAAMATSGSGDRVTFGVEPASASGPDGRPGFVFSATPGGVLFDHVAVLNYSATPLPLRLYATDATETTGGGYGLLPAGAKPTGAGSWISFPSPSASVVVPPGSATGPGMIVVPFTLHVPPHAPPGDHSAGVVASLRTTGTNTSGQTVVLEQRVGTRVLVQVAGALAPGLTISDLHADYEGTLDPVGTGRVRIDYVVRNTGNVNLALDPGIEVTGLLGSAREVNPGRVPLLLPGASLHATAVVTGVWPQVLVHDTVTARPIELYVVGTPRLIAATASTSTWAIPWPLFLIVAVLALGIFLIRPARRRPVAAPRARHAAGKVKVPV